MLDEVAPPGFGHTKGDKKKGVEKGGTAAAFDRARKEGRFKGSKSDMFAIMWSQKNKGDKPHYKPGTDKKYKKYQDEAVKDPSKKKPKAPEFNAAKELVQKSPYMKPALQQKEDVELHDADGNLFATIIDVIKPEPMKVPQSNIPYIDEKLSTKDTKNLNKASILSHSDDPKDQDRARARKTEVDYKDLLRQIASKRKMKQMEEGKSWTDFKKVLGVRKKKKEEKKPEKAMDAGARAKRKLARRDYADKVSGSTENVPDEIKDHKSW